MCKLAILLEMYFWLNYLYLMNSSKTKGMGDTHYPTFSLASLAKLRETTASDQLFQFMNSNEFLSLWLLEFGFVQATVGELEL